MHIRRRHIRMLRQGRHSPARGRPCSRYILLAPGRFGSVGLLLMWQAMGAATAATLVLLATAYQRARKRPLAIAASRTPRLIAVIAGAGMAGAALFVMALGTIQELVITMIAGVLLAGFAAHRHAAPWPAKYAVIGLLASIAIVVLPREADWVSLTLHRSKTNTHRHHGVNENCTGRNWNAPLQIAAIARFLDRQPKGLR